MNFEFFIGIFSVIITARFIGRIIEITLAKLATSKQAITDNLAIFNKGREV